MNIIWKYFRICILFSQFFVHWNLWYLNLKKEESLTGAYIANQNIHRNANLTKSNMQYTLFNTVKYMCWTLCNKVIILYNPSKILIFLLNKSIKDFFENFDQIILRFVEVSVSLYLAVGEYSLYNGTPLWAAQRCCLAPGPGLDDLPSTLAEPGAILAGEDPHWFLPPLPPNPN